MSVTLKFGEKIITADVRKLQDMEDVVFDREWFEGTECRNQDLYYMFRDLAKNDKDLEVITAHHLRYDVTRIPPGTLGLEYVKTVGHYHPKVPGTNVSYPEVYQVLEGSALYFLQKVEPGEEDRVTDVVVIEAKKGDCVIVPPGYGHVTVNSTSRTLEMANWVCRDFSSNYEPIKRFSGAAYFFLKNGFVKNPLYRDVPSLRTLEPKFFPQAGLIAGQDMYELVNEIDKLRFLTAPQDFTAFFSEVL